MSYPSDDYTFRQLQRFMDSIQSNWPDCTKSVLYRAAELMGEAGEVGEKCKKVHRDRGGVPNADDLAGIKKEIGDVLICCVNLASQVGLDIEDVVDAAFTKMRARIATKTVCGSGDDREETAPKVIHCLDGAKIGVVDSELRYLNTPPSEVVGMVRAAREIATEMRGYRYLENGEVIQAGDEYLDPDANAWVPSLRDGQRLEIEQHTSTSYRRRIQETQP